MYYWLVITAVTVPGTVIIRHLTIGFAVVPEQAIKRLDI